MNLIQLVTAQFMKLINITLTRPDGKQSMERLTQVDKATPQFQVPPGSKLSIDVMERLSGATARDPIAKPKITSQRKGKNLILRNGSEEILELSNFYISNDVICTDHI